MKWYTRIIYREDQQGNEGWSLKRNPYFNVVSAAGVVHDILEHPRNDNGTWYHEVSAYGAMIAWRLDYTAHLYAGNNIIRKAKLLAEELGAGVIFQIFERKGECYFDKLPARIPKKTSEYIPTIAKIAAEYSLKFLHVDTENDYFQKESFLPKLIHWIQYWLTHGYVRAMKIINKLGYQPGDLYGTVLNEIKQGLRNQYPYIGTELSIQIDFERCWCEIKKVRGYRD